MADVTPLAEIMVKLLAEDGCPWDREQTLLTLRKYVIEEASEVVDAIENGTPEDHCDELGDLLLQIVFQAALREKEGKFTMQDVVSAICDKMVRRHPHVFGDATAETSEEVLTNWEAIKLEENRKKANSLLSDVTRALPALMYAQKISKKAAKVGFDWPNIAGSLDKMQEELDEIREAVESGSIAQAQEELGDMLFATVNLARKLDTDAEMALRGTCSKFRARFQYVEKELKAQGKAPQTASLQEMDALWERAKSLA